MTLLDPHSNPTAQAEAERLESQIDALQSYLHEENTHFGTFWNHVKEINVLFKSLKAMTAIDRRRLWEQLDSICKEAKERQAESKTIWERRKGISANKRSLVESKIREAYFQAKGGSSASELAVASTLLKEALEWMKNGWSGFNAPTQLFALDDGKMTRPDHDACWARWQEANEMLHSRRRDICERNFSHFQSEAEDAIGTAAYDPKHAKEKVQAIQKEMHGKVMSSEQFSEIRRLLDKAWGHAREKQDERHEEWVDQQHSKIHRKRELISNAEDFIDRIEGQIDHCRDLEAGAKSDDFASTVRGWIEEKYEIIAEKRKFITELEGQIREIESKFHR